MSTTNIPISREQYDFALCRIEALLPEVDDSTPKDDPRCLELSIMSDIVIRYEEEHFPQQRLTTGELIRLGLKEKGKTQRELAEALGVSPSRICDFVGGRSEPSLTLAGKICLFLGISPSLMLGV